MATILSRCATSIAFVNFGTSARSANRFCGPLPAVGHRHDFNLRVRQHIEQPFPNILRDFLRVQRAFEFIWSDKDFHGRS